MHVALRRQHRQPVQIRPEAAQALLEDEGWPLDLALTGTTLPVAGGARLSYRLPQRIWLLWYSPFLPQPTTALRVIAAAEDRRS